MGIKLFKRFTPKSIERQLTESDKPKLHQSKAKFVDCKIDGKVVKINARCLPNDLPSQDDWFRIRVWNDEINGTSLTG